MKYLALVLSFCFVNCATTYSFKDGVEFGQREYIYDSQDCKMKAAQTYGTKRGIIRDWDRESFFEDCMFMKGYSE